MGVTVSAEGGLPASGTRPERSVDVGSFAATARSNNGEGARRAWQAIRRPIALVQSAGGLQAIVLDDSGAWPDGAAHSGVVAVLPALYPEWLGERAFRDAHGVRFAYVIGEMARGIATPHMVVEGVRCGVMAFFGSAGLSLPEIERGVREIQSAVGADAKGWGANLIHSPQEQELELATVDLLLGLGVSCISASAFMRLQPAIVQFMARGLRRSAAGAIVRANRILAKVSRTEVARQFLAPPPETMLRALVQAGRISAEEATLASALPVAEDVTAEADSGGHTDNRPLTVLLPALLQLSADLAGKRGYARAPRIGAAGGLGTPAALAAAFAAGASYVVTGSINQSAIESGLSLDARRLLAQAQSTDVAMAPAADMFEMGVKVQVLKRGTFFAQRGQRLADFYRRYNSFDAAPQAERAELEANVLGRAIDDIWAETEAHFRERDPTQIARAHNDPKHHMALVLRWYLFMGAQWAREGVAERRGDYQIWCGPAMGAFNDWARGSCLAAVETRTVRQIALNLLEGAATVARAGQLRAAGLPLEDGAFDFRPRHFG
jgi:PfaD family protein